MIIRLPLLLLAGIGFGMIILPVHPFAVYDIQSDSIVATTSQIRSVPLDEQVEILFVGDVMLGRGVEALMQEHGIEYPFQHVQAFVSEPDLTVANFEGIVSEEHAHTPSMALRFSIRNEYLSYLKLLGFDILSLANNHSFDYGIEGLSFTREICNEIAFFCGGSPYEINSYSTGVVEVNEKKVGFLFLHTTHNFPNEHILDAAIRTLKIESDVQIAFVHWGEEYALTHSALQQQQAEKLIDAGIDAVVGHHPHVVQDIALYKNKPIFYSLGNFIFDQYFSTDVQIGLGLRMVINKTKIVYSLIGITSTTTRSQPNFMTRSESVALNTRILDNLKDFSEIDVENGTITLLDI